MFRNHQALRPILVFDVQDVLPVGRDRDQCCVARRSDLRDSEILEVGWTARSRKEYTPCAVPAIRPWRQAELVLLRDSTDG